MYLVSLPLSVFINKKRTKKFILNLNVYRNAHFQVLNKAKRIFEEEIYHKIKDLPKNQTKCTLKYILYPRTKRECDVSNICCIEDKFFSDALVRINVLTDDNYKVLSTITYSFGAIDKDNPRVDVLINFNEE